MPETARFEISVILWVSFGTEQFYRILGHIVTWKAPPLTSKRLSQALTGCDAGRV
jgi:hypothetical protein